MLDVGATLPQEFRLAKDRLLLQNRERLVRHAILERREFLLERRLRGDPAQVAAHIAHLALRGGGGRHHVPQRLRRDLLFPQRIRHVAKLRARRRERRPRLVARRVPLRDRRHRAIDRRGQFQDARLLRLHRGFRVGVRRGRRRHPNDPQLATHRRRGGGDASVALAASRRRVARLGAHIVAGCRRAVVGGVGREGAGFEGVVASELASAETGGGAGGMISRSSWGVGRRERPSRGRRRRR